ncbi:hypothetical protein [Altericista sp. CCNU0014]|uniref:hypothetical protein n=1 Tax=Altericista sp. CCNU0014 TaxID=3082949 RepID=UPI0038500723
MRQSLRLNAPLGKSWVKFRSMKAIAPLGRSRIGVLFSLASRSGKGAFGVNQRSGGLLRRTDEVFQMMPKAMGGFELGLNIRQLMCLRRIEIGWGCERARSQGMSDSRGSRSGFRLLVRVRSKSHRQSPASLEKLCLRFSVAVATRLTLRPSVLPP